MNLKNPMILDIETYPNYNLFAFKQGKKVWTFESWDKFSKRDIKAIKKLLLNNLIVTFNGNKYDLPMINYAVQKGATVGQMCKASKSLIEDRVHPYAFMKSVKIRNLLDIKHIDLFEPSPAVMISLKLYGSRLHSKVLWDLPYDPHTNLTKKQAKIIKDYCENDLNVTRDLYDNILDRLEIRKSMSKEYGIDLMSKSDAQIAEAVISSEFLKIDVKAERPRLPDGYTCSYKPPKYIKFKTPLLKKLLKDIKSIKFNLGGGGNVMLPAKLTQQTITIGTTTYKIGIGGLHSQESSLTCTDKMYNVDYASYYPFIIIMNKYFPEHLGKKFLIIYERIVRTRLKAKGDAKKGIEKELNELIANMLKITINGLFGKFGNKWSKVYSPDLMLQVTLTGQLTLLMLIEQFEAKGIKVLSANTDGLEYTGKHAHKAKKIVAKLDKATGYTMEFGEYNGLFARDVNNYVAKYDGYVKTKGVYADRLKTPAKGLDKNVQTPIVFEAVREFILNGTSMKKTINKCKDVREFLSAKTVRGGGMYGGDNNFENIHIYDFDIGYTSDKTSKTLLKEKQKNYLLKIYKKNPSHFPPDWEEKVNSKRGVTKKIMKERDRMEAHWVKDNGTYLGKVVRWYYSENGSSIHYRSNGNKVGKSDGAMPMMTLKKKIPKDLDYNWYYDEAEQALKDLGYV